MRIFFRAVKANELVELHKFMQPLWRQVYKDIISNEQINFLVDKYFLMENIKSFIAKGYQYYWILDDGNIVGAFVYIQNDDYIYLDKLYILEVNRHQGIARMVISNLLEIKGKICLNVNQSNKKAICAYQKLGFIIAKEDVINLSNGMINIDYQMELVKKD